MRTRIIAGAVIKNNQNEYLLCKMANFGVYPNQWGIVGGGLEEGEKIEKTLIREVWEEVGLEVVTYKPLIFNDDQKVKTYSDGSKEEIYMIYLLFEVKARGKVRLNEEWVEYAWVPETQLNEYDLNEKTRENFMLLGLL